MGLWLYALPPPVAASLVIVCSFLSQLQTLPRIWHAIKWKGVLPFIIPGLVGVPIGTRLLAYIDPRTFKIGVGLFLVTYTVYAMARRERASSDIGGLLSPSRTLSETFEPAGQTRASGRYWMPCEM